LTNFQTFIFLFLFAVIVGCSNKLNNEVFIECSDIESYNSCEISKRNIEKWNLKLFSERSDSTFRHYLSEDSLISFIDSKYAVVYTFYFPSLISNYEELTSCLNKVYDDMSNMILEKDSLSFNIGCDSIFSLYEYEINTKQTVFFHGVNKNDVFQVLIMDK